MEMTNASELNFVPAQTPDETPIEGRFIRLEKLNPETHADGLFAALQGPESDPKLWDYLLYGPFPKRVDFDAWLKSHTANKDPWVYCVIDKTNGVIRGNLSLMSIAPVHGRIEIGGIAFGAGMQRTPQSTEAVYILAKKAFEWGYRRLEWKCNNNNARSKRAAERFGFKFEGVFRQHMVVKGCNRDTAWYSILDLEWPLLKTAFERWLSESNFDNNGVQLKTMEDLRAELTR